MKKLLITLLLLASITSVYASDFQWSRLYHNRLNTFVRTTKLPHWQYVIGVYSSGNTITEYTEPTTEVVTKEVIKEVPVEKEIIRYITVEKQVADPRVTTGSYILSAYDLQYLRSCPEYAHTEPQFKDCVFNYLRYTIPVIPIYY